MIEKYDKLRYHILTVYTISWLVLFGIYIAIEFMPIKALSFIFIPSMLIASVVFTVYSVKLRSFSTKINRDIRLKKALNNEMHIQNQLKSTSVGYCVTIAVIAVLFVANLFYPLSGLLLCKLCLYFGVGSALVASLVYNRA